MKRTDLVSVATLLHPLADPALRFSELVIVGSVDEVAALYYPVSCRPLLVWYVVGFRRERPREPDLVVKEIEDAFGRSLVTLAHKFLPENVVRSPYLSFQSPRRCDSPAIAKVHAAQAERADSHGSIRREQTVTAKSRLGRRGIGKCLVHFVEYWKVSGRLEMAESKSRVAVSRWLRCPVPAWRIGSKLPLLFDS